MRKRGNKLGQGLSTSTLVLLILAAIVLIVVVLGFTQGWGYIFDKIGLLPGDLEAAAKSCETSAQYGLKTSYCNEFKKVRVAGKKQWVNCDYLEKYAEFEKLQENCNETTVKNLALQLCNNEKLKDDEKVNDWTCGFLRD